MHDDACMLNMAFAKPTLFFNNMSSCSYISNSAKDL